MKKFRKLIPALCMLLVSALFVGTSTYAWFSMNKTVTAANMQIKAQVNTQLMIKGSAAGAEYKSAIDFVDANDSAVSAKNALTTVPATAYKGRNEAGSAALIKDANGWKKIATKHDLVKDDGTISGGAQDSTWDTAIADMFEKATAGTDYIKDDFTLKLVGEYKTGSSVKYTLKATTTLGENQANPADIYKAIHVAVVATYGESTYLKEIDLGDATVAVEGKNATLSLEDAAFDAFTAANQEHSYSVYIWYDGEDVQCNNANASSIDQFKFNFQFDYVEPTV